MDKIKRMLLRPVEAERLKLNAEDIKIINRNCAFTIISMAIAAFLVFTCFSIFIEAYKIMFVSYCIMLGALAIIWVIMFHVKKLPVWIIYLGYFVFYCFGIFASGFVTTGGVSVFALFIFFQLPIVILDRSWRINILLILSIVVYLIICVPLKTMPNALLEEIMNCLLFGMFGLGIGELLRKSRLERIELRRQSLLREEFDGLTGLYSRNKLFDYLEEIASGTVKTETFGILMLDVDSFKLYNDTYGHMAGDECLKKIGAALTEYGKENNIRFYRYGGEEFVGVIDNCDKAFINNCGKEINERIFALDIPHSRGHFKKVTISIGVASGNDVKYTKLLVSQADVALYKAKRSGGNITVQFEDTMKMTDLSSTKADFADIGKTESIA